MLKYFQQNLFEIISQPTYKKFLLAVSGGVDSMAMIELFTQAKLNFSVAHCNFQLRNEDADLDEQLVQETCTDLQKTIYIQSFQTKETAEKNKESIQITARKLRYGWFQSLMTEHKYDYVVTGHHANDNLETTIYKLAKGTGIKGVRGILPLQKGILRPLLIFTKEDLINFAKKNNLRWREDSSNESLKYKRNFIRHQIIPLLEDINPQVVNNFSQSAERLRLAEEALNEKINLLKNTIIKTNKKEVSTIDKTSLKKHNITPALLYELLNDFKFSYGTCKAIYQNLDKPSGSIYQSNSSFQLLNDRESLILYKNNEDIVKEKIPIKEGKFQFGNKTINISILPYTVLFKFEKDNDIAYFNLEKLDGHFEIRNWQLGDKMAPFGMTGTQKISDILINQKVPFHIKKNELVLSYKGKIIWLIGRRASNLYKTTNSSILRLHVTEHI
jgi:tRNA(Ile)-lysidine synthase